jgi:very-short-patch-repair endonuclease
VDGVIHTIEDIARDDQYRQEQLQNFGLHIIRFTNDQIFNIIEFVLEEIKSTINILSLNPDAPKENI